MLQHPTDRFAVVGAFFNIVESLVKVRGRCARKAPQEGGRLRSRQGHVRREGRGRGASSYAVFCEQVHRIAKRRILGDIFEVSASVRERTSLEAPEDLDEFGSVDFIVGPEQFRGRAIG